MFHNFPASFYAKAHDSVVNINRYIDKNDYSRHGRPRHFDGFSIESGPRNIYIYIYISRSPICPRGGRQRLNKKAQVGDAWPDERKPVKIKERKGTGAIPYNHFWPRCDARYSFE